MVQPEEEKDTADIPTMKEGKNADRFRAGYGVTEHPIPDRRIKEEKESKPWKRKRA